MKKRIFSILLVCCMVLALLPTTALAENGGGVAVDHINFPDSMFRTFIQTSLDINHDGVLSEEEIAATVTIGLYLQTNPGSDGHRALYRNEDFEVP